MLNFWSIESESETTQSVHSILTIETTMMTMIFIYYCIYEKKITYDKCLNTIPVYRIWTIRINDCVSVRTPWEISSWVRTKLGITLIMTTSSSSSSVQWKYIYIYIWIKEINWRWALMLFIYMFNIYITVWRNTINCYQSHTTALYCIFIIFFIQNNGIILTEKIQIYEPWLLLITSNWRLLQY